MLTEDLTQFFQADGLASQATLDGQNVTGIFDRGFLQAGVGSGVASSSPTFVLPSASVPADPVGLPLVVDSDTFTVVATEPDGTGVTTLILEVAA